MHIIRYNFDEKYTFLKTKTREKKSKKGIKVKKKRENPLEIVMAK